jgi:hypothetical protein
MLQSPLISDSLYTGRIALCTIRSTYQEICRCIHEPFYDICKQTTIEKPKICKEIDNKMRANNPFPHPKLLTRPQGKSQKSPKRGSIRRLCANGIDCGACAACLGYVLTTSDRWSILYAKIWTQRPSMGSDPTYRCCWPT